jgi:hypothetical protein
VDRDTRLQQVIQHYLDHCDSAGDLGDEELKATISAHPDLMPELGEELRKIQNILKAKGEANAAHEGQLLSTTDAKELQFEWSSAAGSGSSDLATGVPDYDLLHRIGRGGFGEVWLARNHHTGQFYALKLIPQSKGIELDGIRAYKRRAQDHPHLVPIEHVGNTGAFIYYIMPLADDVKGSADVRGPQDYEAMTLQQYMQRHAPLPLDEVLTIADHLLAAVEHLHASGLLHKDIKPGNVMRMRGVWRLGDMGLTTLCEEVASDRGTRSFWPPEGPRDRTADLYALGKTLYLLLTGARLDRFQDFVDGRMKIPGDDSRAEALRQIILRACHNDPSHRYSSAGEMRRAIGALKLHRRHISRRSIVLGVLAAGIVCLLGLMVTKWISGTPGPAVLKELAIYLRRGDDRGAPDCLELVANGRDREVEPIRPPLSPKDHFQLDGAFERPTHWYLAWFDTQGQATVAAQSDVPQVELEYPIGKMVRVNPKDPPGVHVLVLMAGTGSRIESAELLKGRFQGIGAPPPQLPQRWAGQFRGPGGTIPAPNHVSPSKYLRAIQDRMPPGLEQVYALFLETKK